MKKKFYIPIDSELHRVLLKIAEESNVTLSDLIKLIANIKVKTVQLKEFNPYNKLVAYYAEEKLLNLTKANVNYKILRFIELYEQNFQ